MPETTGIFKLLETLLNRNLSITISQIKSIIFELQQLFDFILIDCPAGIDAGFKRAVSCADEALVVTTKRGMEEIDFLTMFMTCFSSDLSVESFAEIYNIDCEAPVIHAPSLKGVLSPLIVLHFLGIVSRIKSLKKGYVHYSENLKKVKGHIQVMKNERKNIASKRFDRVFCDFDEYTVDIPENRLIKKALLFSSQILRTITQNHSIGNKAKLMLSKSLALFENVSDEV